jgi:hypothetical protein
LLNASGGVMEVDPAAIIIGLAVYAGMIGFCMTVMRGSGDDD